MKVPNIFRFLALAIAGCFVFVAVTYAKTDKTNSAAKAISQDYDANKKEKGLQFSVLGDWGWNGKRNQTEVAKIMAKHGVGSFIISAGDNFQVVGVRSVQDPLWMLTYEMPFSDPSLECEWYVALGNHDYKGEVQAEIDYSKISRRWNMPARYFAVHKRINDTTAADFYIIDTSPFQSAHYKTD
jgi:tartrate-resistant acid phosphatase type 5